MTPFTAQSLPLKGINYQRHSTKIGAARAAVARFEEALFLNNAYQHFLIAPMQNREAVLSNHIEGTKANVGQLLLFQAGGHIFDPTIRIESRETLNYKNALIAGTEDIRGGKPFNLGLLKELHRILMVDTRGDGEVKIGEFRRDQNAIIYKDEIKFIPPEPENVLALMENWKNYYAGIQDDPILQIAILHAQFEIIHPFGDGNGRMGRLLIPLFLYEKGVLRGGPSFYMSAWLMEHRSQYYSSLNQIDGTPETWDNWIEFFLSGVVIQAENDLKRIETMRRKYKDLEDQFQDFGGSKFSVQVLNRLFETPKFHLKQIKIPGCSEDNLRQIIYRLMDKGLIIEEQKGKRGSPAIYNLKSITDLIEV